jgi:hypothetical protein
VNNYSPSEFYLSQNYPNPFRGKTTIKYCVAYTTQVILTIYNSEGVEIEKLVDEVQKPGTYEVEYVTAVDVLRDQMYFYRLEAGNYSSVKKMEILHMNPQLSGSSSKME